jgi:Lrp/AsnC family transcriptional regulator for asnA, asnC and gidA
VDKKDSRLLEALDIDPRMPLNQLARKMAVSPQVANYRLSKLFETGAIKKAGTIVNLSKIGYAQYKVFFRFKGINENLKKEIFNYIGKHKKTYWVSRVGGEFDLFCAFVVRTFKDFDKFLDEISHRFPNSIMNYVAFYGLDHEFYGHKHWNKKDILIKCPIATKVYKPDELDFKILRALKDNCRLSSFNIGTKIGVSYKTVQNRVKKLEKEGVISGYRIFIKDTVHKPFIVLFSYNNIDRNKESRLFAELRQSKPVTQAMKLFGEWNLFLIVRPTNLENLQDFIIQLRDKYDIILEHEIVPIFEDVTINLLPEVD